MQILPKRYGLVIILLACAFHAKTQVRIIGTVKQLSGDPVSNASIKIKDSSRGLIKYFTLSDDAGSYSVLVPPGFQYYMLECSFAGFVTHSFQMNHDPVGAGTILHNIILVMDTVELQEVHVRSAPAIRVSGDTTSFRVEVFKQGNESNISDLLNNIPGFSVENGKVSYNGRSVNRLLIEGDDLFGRDYTTITKNLGPGGIEKVELIDHYKDNTYLANRLQQGKELVLNLKFDKKFLYRITTSSDWALAPAGKYYHIRENILSLIPKLTFVTSANVNNTGLLGADIAGGSSVSSAGTTVGKEPINFDSEQPYKTAPVAQIPDIQSAMVPKNGLYFNNTKYVSNNLLYKPSSQWRVRNTIQYYLDSYRQSRSSQESYLTPGVSLVVFNRQSISKKLPAFNISNELVFSPKPAMQLVYRVHYFNERESDSIAELRQSIYDIRGFLVNRSSGYRQQLSFSSMLDSNRVFEVQGAQFHTHNRNLFQVFPSGIFSSITSDTSSKTANSAIDDVYQNVSLDAKLSVRRNTMLNSWRLFYAATNSNLLTGLSLYDVALAPPVKIPGFLSDTRLNIQSAGAEMRISGILGDRLTWDLLQKAEVINSTLLNSQYLPVKRSDVRYLPSVELSLNVSRIQRLNFQWAIKSVLPNPYELISGAVVVNSTTVLQGIHALYTGVTSRATLAYTYSDPAVSKLTAYGAVSYSQEPIVYLMNTTPGILFTINNRMRFSEKGRSIHLLGNTSKYFRGIKSQLDINVITLWHNSYYSFYNKPGTFSVFNITNRIKCKTLITDRLITTLSWQGSVVVNQYDKDTPLPRTQRGHTNTYLAALSWRFFNRVSFSVKYQPVTQSYGNAHYRFDFGEISLRYTSKNQKVEWEISGNHIFSKGSMTNTAFNYNSTLVQSVDLLPSFLLGRIRFEL